MSLEYQILHPDSISNQIKDGRVKMNQFSFSRKKMRKGLLPSINDNVVGVDGAAGVVTYVNNGDKMRFTAVGHATMDEMIEIETRLFQVNRVADGKFNASFVGIKQNPDAVPAPEVEEEVIKVID